MDGVISSVTHSEDTLPVFPIPSGWSYSASPSNEELEMCDGTPVSYSDGIPVLTGIVNRYIANPSNERSSYQRKRRGWQGPGPGPKHGMKRLPLLEDLQHPLHLAVLHLVKECMHFQQLYGSNTLTSESCPLNFADSMEALRNCEMRLPVSQAMKKNIWTLTHQLGVPAFLIKLRSPYHAIAMNLLPDRPGRQWWCSYCRFAEISTIFRCTHSDILNNCIDTIAEFLHTTPEYLVDSMAQSSAFNHITDIPQTAFYSVSGRLQLAVLKIEGVDSRNPSVSFSRLHIVKQLSLSRGWKCLSRECSGYAVKCSHAKAVQRLVDQGSTHCFLSIHELQDESAQGNYETDIDASSHDDETHEAR